MRVQAAQAEPLAGTPASMNALLDVACGSGLAIERARLRAVASAIRQPSFGP